MKTFESFKPESSITHTILLRKLRKEYQENGEYVDTEENIEAPDSQLDSIYLKTVIIPLRNLGITTREQFIEFLSWAFTNNYLKL